MSQNWSLLAVYSITEESCQIKSEYTHLQEKLIKSQKLQFYRDLIQRNMSVQQIASLKMIYISNLLSAWNYYLSLNFYQSSQIYSQHSSQMAAHTISATQEYYFNNCQNDHLLSLSYQHNRSDYQHHQSNYESQSLLNSFMAAVSLILQQS